MNTTSPRIIAVISTKGGVGKTTLSANLGAYAADIAGQRVLLVDLDVQPTLTSYYPLPDAPTAGIRELLLLGNHQGHAFITPTAIPNVDVLASNDPYNEVSLRLMQAADGRFRLKRLLPEIAQGYDLVIIDTQGARSVLLDAAILAAHELVSPVPTQTLAAREFLRGTISLLNELAPLAPAGLPPLSAVLNAVDHTVDSQKIASTLRQDVFADADPSQFRLLQTVIPAMAAYREAATARIPAHRYESRRPAGRKTPAAAEVMAALAAELGLVWGHAPAVQPAVDASLASATVEASGV